MVSDSQGYSTGTGIAMWYIFVSDEELRPGYILPAVFDSLVKDAVAKAARKSEMTRI